METVIRLGSFLSKTSMLWLMLAAGLAFIWPHSFFVLVSYQYVLMGVMSFILGISLKRSDFFLLLLRPLPVILGIALRFSLIYLLTFVLKSFMVIPPELLIGLIIWCSSPVDPLVNAVTYLRRGDLALSFLITCGTILLSPVLPPLMLYFASDQLVQVNTMTMLISLLMTIVLPGLAGMCCGHYVRARLRIIYMGTPIFILIILILTELAALSLCSYYITHSGTLLIPIVIGLNVIVMGIGAMIARLAGCNQAQCRTIGFTSAMGYNAMSMILGVLNFTVFSAVPSAFAASWQHISGLSLSRVVDFLCQQIKVKERSQDKDSFFNWEMANAYNEKRCARKKSRWYRFKKYVKQMLQDSEDHHGVSTPIIKLNPSLVGLEPLFASKNKGDTTNLSNQESALSTKSLSLHNPYLTTADSDLNGAITIATRHPLEAGHNHGLVSPVEKAKLNTEPGGNARVEANSRSSYQMDTQDTYEHACYRTLAPRNSSQTRAKDSSTPANSSNASAPCGSSPASAPSAAQGTITHGTIAQGTILRPPQTSSP